MDVIGVGKIEDIFAFRGGLTQSDHTGNNKDTMKSVIKFVKEENEGLIIANLIDFDMLFGHRNDPQGGYACALEETDGMIRELAGNLKEGGDVLAITADHGCDPTAPGTDHSREYVPLLVYGKLIQQGVFLGTRSSLRILALQLQIFWKSRQILQARVSRTEF